MGYYILHLLCILIWISDVQNTCTTVNYPVGLRGAAGVVKYLSVEHDLSGKLLLAGSTTS